MLAVAATAAVVGFVGVAVFVCYAVYTNRPK